MIHDLYDPKAYPEEIGPLNRIACLVTVSIPDEKKYVNVFDHNKLLFISGILGKK